MTAIISFILSFFAALGALFGGGAEPQPEPTAEPAHVLAVTPAPRPTPEPDAPIQAVFRAVEAASYRADRESAETLPYDDIEYVHYDPEGFYAAAKDLVALAEAGDAEALCTQYDRMYDEFLFIDALSVIAMLEHDADFRNEYWADEYSYINSVWAECQDAFLSAGSDVMHTEAASDFRAHVGRDTASLFRWYDSDESYDATADERELELLDEYYDLYDTLDGLTFSYRGHDWTFEELNGFRGDALAYENYDGYLAVYAGLQRAVAEAIAPVYIELVELWTQEARDAGYDSYADYAYEQVYARDFTTEDAQRFCDAVKPIAREYYADLYYADLYYDAADVKPAYSGEELIALIGEYLPRIDESLVEPWQAMTERGLYDVAPVSSGRYDGAYTTMLLYYHAPFLFASLTGGSSDLVTLTHEFGHFCDYWFSPQTNYFTQTDSLDLSEIHSNALQGLFSRFYGEIYDRGADAAEFALLADLLENVIDGCFYDEFQRRVFADPDGLTPERLNAVYLELCEEYGIYEDGYLEWDSSWAYIAHNFSQPMYYISYAASGIAAIQIWDMAQSDWDGAVDTYLNILSRGSWAEDYGDVLSDAGLRLFWEEGVVEDVCLPTLDRMEALDRAS